MKANKKRFRYTVLGCLLINVFLLNAAVTASEDVFFRDDFMGKALAPEWEVGAKDASRMALVDNEHLLLVTYGPAASAKNRMTYKGDLPENYEITLKAEASPESRFQGFALGINRDSKNRLTVYYQIDNITNAYAYFGKLLNGEWSQYGSGNILPKGKPLFLRLTKKGVEYTGYYSPDGATWSKLGTHVFINLKGRPYFVAYNTKKKVPESGIKFDYFEIRKTDQPAN